MTMFNLITTCSEECICIFIILYYYRMTTFNGSMQASKIVRGQPVLRTHWKLAVLLRWAQFSAVMAMPNKLNNTFSTI